MRASTKAINLIKEVEGWSGNCYSDGGGYKTIGWGHLVDKDEYCPDQITEAQGEKYLADDIADAEFAVRSTVTVPLKQHQFDTLVSFLFNIGPTKWAISDTLKILNAGEYHRIPARLMMWNKITKHGVKVEDEGLINRRLKEVRLWLGE